MSKVHVELNSAGVRELLRSEAMGAVLNGHAAAIAARCGPGYDCDSKLMPTRRIASVFTAGAAAAKDNEENNTILRALK